MVGVMTLEEKERQISREREALGLEAESTLQWLLSEQRSVQEVEERLALLPDVQRTGVEEAMSQSSVYGSAFMRHLYALSLRDNNRGNNIRPEASRYRREAPAGYQRVLKEITRLREVGRNVMALTPELLPEDLVRIWPQGRPLPELVVVNLDHPIPQVSLVRRLPSAGGLAIPRAELQSMTGLLRLVLGNPSALREMAASQGLGLDNPFEQVNVSLTEIAWSPHLELGELLYDTESLRDENQDVQNEGRMQALETRLMGSGELFQDLDQRLGTLLGGWEREPSQDARNAEGRLHRMADRIKRLQGKNAGLKDTLAALEMDVVKGNQGDVAGRLKDLLAESSKLDKAGTELAATLVEEERLLDEQRISVPEAPRSRPSWDSLDDEDEEGTGRKKDRKKAKLSDVEKGPENQVPGRER